MKNISELFLPYNLALIAKEKGFDELCFGYYYNNEPNKIYPLNPLEKIQRSNNGALSSLAPLYQQVTDWFIKKNIHIFPMYFHNTKKYLYMVYDENKFSQTSYTTMNKAIEEAFKLI